jgi:hypothetical protein
MRCRDGGNHTAFDGVGSTDAIICRGFDGAGSGGAILSRGLVASAVTTLLAAGVFASPGAAAMLGGKENPWRSQRALGDVRQVVIVRGEEPGIVATVEGDERRHASGEACQL